MLMHAMRNGLTFDSLTPRLLYANWGSVTNGYPQTGGETDEEVYNSWRALLCDVENQGTYLLDPGVHNWANRRVGGRVEATPYGSGQPLYFWIVQHVPSGDLVLMCAKEPYFSAWPEDYRVIRKMPFEVSRRVTGDPLWNGLPVFHHDGLWTYLTGNAKNDCYLMLSGGSAVNWTPLSLAPYLGESSRRVRLYWEADCGNGNGGTVAIKAHGSAGSENLCTVGPGHPFAYGTVEVQLDSARAFSWSAYPSGAWQGPRIRMWLRAWQMQEMC